MSGLEINRPRAAVVGLLADRRLYLTRDESRVVEEGSPEAAFLFATPGTIVPAADADRLGLNLVDGRITLPGTEPVGVPSEAPPPAPPTGKTESGRKPKGKDVTG